MKRKTQAFTLLELMIVVALTADLAAIAVPAFLRSRDLAQNTRFVSDLRTAASAFEMYAAENNNYPANSAPGVVPTGMAVYLDGLAWTVNNSIGAQWDWEFSSPGTLPQIGARFGIAPTSTRMQDIDRRMDNGVLTTGQFRGSASYYAYYLE